MFVSAKFVLKHKTRAAFALAVAFAALALASSAAAQLASDPMQSVGVRPDLLKQVGIDQKLNQPVPLDLTFRDETRPDGATRPIFRAEAGDPDAGVLQLPDAVHASLNGVESGLKELPMDIGKQFNVVTVSIDPSEGHVLAEVKQEMYTGMYGRPGRRAGMAFPDRR